MVPHENATLPKRCIAGSRTKLPQGFINSQNIFTGYTFTMIGHLEGTVRKIGAGHIIVSAGGVGYKVALTHLTLAEMRTGKTASLWTHIAVRENALDLYGFKDEAELRVFELLLTVSGIGPRSALAVLDVADVETLRSAISQGNAIYLTKVSGIGKKNAEKIVLELKDKLVGISADMSQTMSGDVDALLALQSLGYPEREAREALKKVSDVKDAGEKVKKALKILS